MMDPSSDDLLNARNQFDELGGRLPSNGGGGDAIQFTVKDVDFVPEKVKTQPGTTGVKEKLEPPGRTTKRKDRGRSPRRQTAQESSPLSPSKGRSKSLVSISSETQAAVFSDSTQSFQNDLEKILQESNTTFAFIQDSEDAVRRVSETSKVMSQRNLMMLADNDDDDREVLVMEDTTTVIISNETEQQHSLAAKEETTASTKHKSKPFWQQRSLDKQQRTGGRERETKARRSRRPKEGERRKSRISRDAKTTDPHTSRRPRSSRTRDGTRKSRIASTVEAMEKEAVSTTGNHNDNNNIDNHQESMETTTITEDPTLSTVPEDPVTTTNDPSTEQKMETEEEARRRRRKRYEERKRRERKEASGNDKDRSSRSRRHHRSTGDRETKKSSSRPSERSSRVSTRGAKTSSSSTRRTTRSPRPQPGAKTSRSKESPTTTPTSPPLRRTRSRSMTAADNRSAPQSTRLHNSHNNIGSKGPASSPRSNKSKLYLANEPEHFLDCMEEQDDIKALARNIAHMSKQLQEVQRAEKVELKAIQKTHEHAASKKDVLKLLQLEQLAYQEQNQHAKQAVFTLHQNTMALEKAHEETYRLYKQMEKIHEAELTKHNALIQNLPQLEDNLRLRTQKLERLTDAIEMESNMTEICNQCMTKMLDHFQEHCVNQPELVDRLRELALRKDDAAGAHKENLTDHERKILLINDDEDDTWEEESESSSEYESSSEHELTSEEADDSDDEGSDYSVVSSSSSY